MNKPVQTQIPRWRGFNLLDMFTTHSDGNFSEDDFRWMADWGFNFARIPACYTLWISGEDTYSLFQPMMEKVDRVVRLGQKYGIHISLNFHRAPGYSVNRERKEPYNLWKDQAALDAFCFHWQTFAKRFHGIPSSELSFDLVNEPPQPNPEGMTRGDHERVVRAAVRAINNQDSKRLIIMDGLGYGRIPCPELIDTGIAQSCRAYNPMGISHYKASWVNGQDWPYPQWPNAWHYGESWGKRELEQAYQPWIDLAAQGACVHCGEAGAYNYTPHHVVLAWFNDVLEILTSHNIGYALWNFRGSFGIMDSNRADVKYVDWYGHQLDRSYLELLQKY